MWCAGADEVEVQEFVEGEDGKGGTIGPIGQRCRGGKDTRAVCGVPEHVAAAPEALSALASLHVHQRRAILANACGRRHWSMRAALAPPHIYGL